MILLCFIWIEEEGRKQTTTIMKGYCNFEKDAQDFHLCAQQYKW
jgi:hypothetical protein